MRFRIAAAALAVVVPVTCASPATASPKGWADASDIGRDLLVGAALGVPAIQGDWRGDLEAGGQHARRGRDDLRTEGTDP
jgi:hypothetical protein